MRTILNWRIALACMALCRVANAQEPPGKRLAGIAAVAVAEYRLGVDSAGKIIAKEELDEAKSFFAEAREFAARLTGTNRPQVIALVDSLARAIGAATRTPVVDALYDRLVLALGADGALDYPSRHFDLAAGAAIYQKTCAPCHGTSGGGDGPAGKGLNPPPAVLAGRDAREIAPGLMYRVVSVGVKGTAMPSWADSLSSDQRWDVVAYVDSLRSAALGVPSTLTTSALRSTPAAVQTEVLAKLDSAMVAGRNGRLTDAVDRAFDAYATFEPLERMVKPRDPAFVSKLEGDFTAFRSALHAGELGAADSAMSRLRAQLPRAVELASTTSSGWTAFGESLLIILREGFEAILIIGAIVAMLARTGNGDRTKDVWLGAGLGVVASGVTAFVLQSTLQRIPATRETIEGATLLVAVAVLFSVSYWIMSKAEARRWQEYVKGRVTAAVEGRGRAALIGIGFLVVYREGAETALFYQALLQAPAASAAHIWGGLVAGSVALTGVYLLLNAYGVKIPLRSFFGVTGALLYAMSVVFMGKGLRELQEGGTLSATHINGAPMIDAIGVYPTVETLVGQVVLILLFAFACWHTFVRPLPPAPPGSPGAPGQRSA